MKMAVIGLVVGLGMAGVVMGQEGAGSAPATQAGVKMEQGHPWPVNDNEATKEQLQAKGKWLLEQARMNAMPGIGVSSSADPEDLKKRLTELQMRYDQFQLESAEKRARRDAVAKQIQLLTAKAREQADNDAILGELEKVAAARDEAAARLNMIAKSGTAAQADVEGAVAAAAEAHVKLEERREAVMGSVGGGILPELAKELVALSIDEDVERENLKSLVMVMEPLQQALDDVEELGRVEQGLMVKYHATIDR